VGTIVAALDKLLNEESTGPTRWCSCSAEVRPTPVSSGMGRSQGAPEDAPPIGVDLRTRETPATQILTFIRGRLPARVRVPA
jgi:hypothetical protein